MFLNDLALSNGLVHFFLSYQTVHPQNLWIKWTAHMLPRIGSYRVWFTCQFVSFDSFAIEIISAPRSAIAYSEAWGWPPSGAGIILASTTLSPWTPFTRSSVSSTVPSAQVPAIWWCGLPIARIRSSISLSLLSKVNDAIPGPGPISDSTTSFPAWVKVRACNNQRTPWTNTARSTAVEK